MFYISDVVTLVTTAAFCAFIAGHRGRPLWQGIGAAAILGILGAVLAGTLGMLFGCAVAVVTLLVLPKQTQHADSGTSANGDPTAREVACPKCRRIVASTTKVCPRCMGRLDAIAARTDEDDSIARREASDDENP
jgi:hypothetical protein